MLVFWRAKVRFEFASTLGLQHAAELVTRRLLYLWSLPRTASQSVTDESFQVAADNNGRRLQASTDVRWQERLVISSSVNTCPAWLCAVVEPETVRELWRYGTSFGDGGDREEWLKYGRTGLVLRLATLLSGPLLASELHSQWTA